jgi:hypothetical protein
MDRRRKFGLTFHRTFSLVRPAVASVLGLAVEYAAASGEKTSLSLDAIRERTNLGSVYVEAMPRYARATGLLDDLLSPTEFGALAHQQDPRLEQSDTQWLMHYHISAPHGTGPAFWHHFVKNRFRSGDAFTRDELSQQIAAFVEDVEARSVTARDANATATVFLGTYTKTDAFGGLCILEEAQDGLYRVLEPESPSIWVLAYALLDFWEAHFPQQLTVNLNDLSGPDGLTSIFLIGVGRLNAVLRAMQEEGYVDVHRVAPPYQVVLLNRDRQSLLDRIYGYH